MLRILSFFLISILIALLTCNSGSKIKISNNIAGFDTIQTKSGLKYYYVKKGNGRKVETDSEVSTYLSLKVKDSVVWTSFDEKDSLFTFIANRDRMIKGFTEMVMLLREDDEVVAVLPYSLGYGKKGIPSDGIPPYATLVYNIFKVVKVSEPKKLLSDILLPIIEKKGIEKMIEKYQQIFSSQDSSKFHRGIGQAYSMWYELDKKESHDLAFEVISFFTKIEKDCYTRSLAATSLEKMGQLQQSMDSLSVLINEYPDIQYLKNSKKELIDKISKPIK